MVEKSLSVTTDLTTLKVYKMAVIFDCIFGTTLCEDRALNQTTSRLYLYHHALRISFLLSFARVLLLSLFKPVPSSDQLCCIGMYCR